MARAVNTKLVSTIDCPGGGQVCWDNNILYVSHMQPTNGTSIYDVADPKNPKLLARLEIPMGWHSHKVRAANGLMLQEMARLWDCSWSPEQLQAAARELAKAALTLGVVTASSSVVLDLPDNLQFRMP